MLNRLSSACTQLCSITQLTTTTDRSRMRRHLSYPSSHTIECHFENPNKACCILGSPSLAIQAKKVVLQNKTKNNRFLPSNARNTHRETRSSSFRREYHPPERIKIRQTTPLFPFPLFWGENLRTRRQHSTRSTKNVPTSHRLLTTLRRLLREHA